MSAESNIKLPETEQLIVSTPPHLHGGGSIRKIMLLVILALAPACLAGIYFFGLNALKILIFCTVFCVAIEVLWGRIAGRPDCWKDCSAALTGILLAMNLNAGVPWWLCLIGAAIAIGLGKQLYGGIGYNPFNPTLVARVVLLIGFPKIMTTWNQPIPGRFIADTVTCATPLGIVKSSPDAAVGNFASIACPDRLFDYAIGNVPGCLGETSAVALLVGGLILICLKIIRWQVPFAYIGSVAVFAGTVHYFSPSTNPGIFFHLFTGGLFLGAFFMATDMVTSPMTGKGALIFGLGCGVITCLIRFWGSYPEGVSFAILIMNALTPMIDRFTSNKPFGLQEMTVEKKGAAA